MHERLPTGERMSKWSGSVNTACMLRQNSHETLTHLFFECSYSSQLWETLIKGVMGSQYISIWRGIIKLALDHSQGKIKLFTVRYVLQTAVHTIWRERNKGRHEEAPSPVCLLIKVMDKNMRNKFSIIRKKKGDKEYE